MQSRLYFPWFICLLFSINLHAQPASVQGIVLAEDGSPVPNAYLILQSENEESAIKTAVTDDSGYFQISNIAAGSYTFRIRSLGFETLSASFTFTSGESKNQTFYLKSAVYEDEITVITASRTQKDIEDVSVPVTVVNQKDIELSGSTRLGEVLAEQTGINLVSDHGKGIQVQGFDPEYTLILVDNQPLIGRTAGTLDLDRISVGDIKQIEIVKGPSSALWGSDALAGVINIITEKGSEPFKWDVSARYGSNTSYDGSSSVSFRKNKLKGRIFGNINGSGGFDLNPETISPTVPENSNYTLAGGLQYDLLPQLKFGIQSRFFREELAFSSEINTSNSTERVDADEYQYSYSINPDLIFHLGDVQLFELNTYFSRFQSENKLTYSGTENIFVHTNFDQLLNKVELKSSTFWNEENTSILGAGIEQEKLNSQNYSDAPTFNSFFFFGQHEWNATEEFSLTSGFRFDSHSEYDAQLSPKVSALYKPSDLIHIRASLGGGFKAPGFSELFLNFTNSQIGYSVFGSTSVQEGIQSLEESGQIKQLLIDPSTIGPITAEHSFAYNAGIDLFPATGLQLRLNVFRNNVRNLLETQRIAIKKNDQSVFTYFNLSRIYTQGIETELRYRPVKDLRITLGYQLLDAKQQIKRQYDDVIDGKVVTKTRVDHIPLKNRSKHSWNARLSYNYEPSRSKGS